jgi:hypothetical protein
MALSWVAFLGHPPRTAAINIVALLMVPLL